MTIETTDLEPLMKAAELLEINSLSDHWSCKANESQQHAMNPPSSVITGPANDSVPPNILKHVISTPVIWKPVNSTPVNSTSVVPNPVIGFIEHLQLSSVAPYLKVNLARTSGDW